MEDEATAQATMTLERETPRAPDPLEKLHPTDFIDDDGATRQLFNFQDRSGNNIGVVFYTREELPFSQEVVSGKHAIVLGEPPKHRDREDWEGFVKDIRESSDGFSLNEDSASLRQAVEQDKTILFVENTPVHILDLAFRLGASGEQWRLARQKAALERIYTPDTLDLIDDMIAGATVDESGNIHRRENQEGEALAVLALLGDTQARETLDARKKVIEHRDEERVEQKQELKAEEANIQERLRVTHVTAYKPQVTENGVLIRSSFDGSDGVMTRNTIHFTLGSAVTGQYGGETWEAMPYMITGDLLKIRDVNSNPLMINPVDTYFMVNPGQPLFIPEGHLTMPGWLPSGTVREVRDNITIYKDRGFTPDDIDTLFADYYDKAHPSVQKWAQEWIKSQVGGNGLRIWLFKDSRIPGTSEYDPGIRGRNIKMDKFVENIDPEEFFNNLRTIGVEGTAHKLLDSNDLFDSDDVTKLIHSLESWITTVTRNADFDDRINYIYDDLDTKTKEEEIKVLAASLGTKGSSRPQAHSEDTQAGFGLTNVAGKVFDRVRKVKKELEQWEMTHDESDTLRPNRVDMEDTRVNMEDRKSIMKFFREKSRIDLSEPDTILRSELRRMLFVAGVI